jgi:hypothetical protein
LVTAHQASSTVQSDAQTRLQSSRDAAARALVSQSDDFKKTVAAMAGHGAVIDSLREPTPAALREVQDELSLLARSKDSPAAFVSDTGGRIVAIYPAQPAVLGQDLSYRDWFQGVSRADSPYVSAAYRTVATGRGMVVAVAAPVLDGSRRVGDVILLWQLDSVRSVSEGARRDDGVTMLVAALHRALLRLCQIPIPHRR